MISTRPRPIMNNKENYADAISGLLKEQGYLSEEDEYSFKKFLLY